MFDTAEVRRLLGRLREADRGHEVFGAAAHRWRLSPVAREAQLRAWEREHGVELPPDYRAFLAEFGNGGAGPDYGLFPLGLWDGAGAALEPWAPHAGLLRAPFPHRAAWNLPADRLEPPDDLDDDARHAWQEALDDEYFAAALLDGAFWICHHGCALRTVLVVTGPERGNVWLDGRSDYGGLAPHLDGVGRHLGFSDWYLGWLERSLREAGG